MSNYTEIKSSKIYLQDVFEMWFRIPEYQRPYVWGTEEIHDLLDDLAYAAANKPEAEYFMGSFVFQARPANPASGQLFEENDLLDGQQRLTTLLLLFAVMRDLTTQTQIKETCQACIYQEANPFKLIPERLRLIYYIRPVVEKFFEDYVKRSGFTAKNNGKYLFAKFAADSEDVSVKNIAKGIEVIEDYLASDLALPLGEFLTFLLNRVLMIYVSTENMEDAFRLFTILNDRGIPLRNSDILKSINLGALATASDKLKYAQMWEKAEGELRDGFDRFLNYIRTILVKEKARLSLLREFEDKIYDPKEKEKASGAAKPRLLQKGKPTFELIERYLSHYRTVLGGDNYNTFGSFAFDNLIRVMETGLPSTDWVPPVLRFYDRFGETRLLDFLHAVNRKFAGDWISQQTPTDRIEAMNAVIRLVEESPDVDLVLASELFKFDKDSFKRALEGNVYGRRFARYVLLMLDYHYQHQAQKMHFDTLSVEHILPQKPAEDSQWSRDFSEALREEWTDRLGNLVTITRTKNASQGRLDYVDKKQRYFLKNIDTCPNSLRVLNQHATWTLTDLSENHGEVVTKMLGYFGVSAAKANLA